MDQTKLEDAVGSHLISNLHSSKQMSLLDKLMLIKLILLLLFCTYTAIAINSYLAVECLPEHDEVWKIQWPLAAPGSTQSVRCPGEGDTISPGLAHRSCLSGGTWGPVDATACESSAVREVRIKVLIIMFALVSQVHSIVVQIALYHNYYVQHFVLTN